MFTEEVKDATRKICDAWQAGRQKGVKADSMKHAQHMWLQVQGNGVCDEYFFGTEDRPWNTPRGDYRYMWMALQEAMYPEPTAAENMPFGDEVYRELGLRKAGERMCGISSDDATD